jgi:hypothetical protein
MSAHDRQITATIHTLVQLSIIIALVHELSLQFDCHKIFMRYGDMYCWLHHKFC